MLYYTKLVIFVLPRSSSEQVKTELEHTWLDWLWCGNFQFDLTIIVNNQYGYRKLGDHKLSFKMISPVMLCRLVNINVDDKQRKTIFF